MLLTYLTWVRPGTASTGSQGVLVLGPDEPDDEPPPVEVIPARLRLLPGDEPIEAVLRALGKMSPGQELDLQVQLRPKLIGLPLKEAGIGPESLASGRLPTAPDEVLAGPEAPGRDRLKLDNHTLTIVGRLKPDAALFARSYLVPRPGATDDLFPDGDGTVHPARLIRLTTGQMRQRLVLQQLEATYPPPRFTWVMPTARLARGAYYLYLTGQALFLVAGSGALIGLFRWAALRARPHWLAAPLLEIRRRPYLVWAVHLAYFGLVLLGAVLVYEWPTVQAVLVASVRAGIGGSGGPLAVAGRAYGSGSVVRAAAVTFLINFLLGSLAVISLPSVVLPGLGAVTAAVRAMTWGLLLGPTSAPAAGAMLPHTGTMLLEGEGYVLAALFGLLIPVYLLQPGSGGTAWSRFGHALRLNVQANVLVALVLAVAAVYEAIEVIGMMR
jgi:hypothetical protein